MRRPRLPSHVLCRDSARTPPTWRFVVRAPVAGDFGWQFCRCSRWPAVPRLGPTPSTAPGFPYQPAEGVVTVPLKESPVQFPRIRTVVATAATLAALSVGAVVVAQPAAAAEQGQAPT